MDIRIELTKTPKEKPADESKLGFAKAFSDHMFVMDYTEGQGWHDARIVPYQPFEIDPATVVLHYAQEIFEGLKAYRTADNKIQLFRPDCNGKRMNDSADRLCIPNIPVEDFVQAVKTLVEVDKDWVPHLDGSSYYIRPFIFANDVGLGVHASKHYVFCIIGAPSGAYYAEGINPVRIYVEDEYIRAAPGLTGFTKCGGNYAASIKAGEMAEEQGFAQVLWLDGVEKKYVEEVGSMNIMFKIDGKIYTAACTGTVLPGVTRRSIIELCKDWGYEVIEGKLAIADVMQAAKEGKLEEVWGTGTAAVVSPVKELKWKDEVAYISDGKIYTAACTGTVLPGVTRRSIIELCKDWGYEVIEGKLAIADIMKAAREGKLEEVFGTGTAAVVSPVKELRWKDETAYISGGKIGPLTQKLYDTLTGIQWGKLPDTKGWTVEV